jgi:hypothetical protein
MDLRAGGGWASAVEDWAVGGASVLGPVRGRGCGMGTGCGGGAVGVWTGEGGGGVRHRRACGGRGQGIFLAGGCEGRGCVPERTVRAIAAAARPG